MTARFETRQRFDHPARMVFELLNDPEFLERKARDFGATTAKVRASTAADGTVVVVTEIWEPARLSPGKGQDHRTLTTRTNPETLCGTWVHVVDGQEDRSKSEGTSEVVSLGPERCEVVTRGFIEIRVPVVGKMIERKVAAAVEANEANEQRYVAAALRERAAG